MGTKNVEKIRLTVISNYWFASCGHSMCEEAIRLSNQNDTQTHYNPSHVGMKPRGFGNNKGKKMQDTSGKHAQVIQTKGE